MTTFTLPAYNHDGLLLNLSGTRDAEECVIKRIEVSGNSQNLIDLFDAPTLESMAHNADMRLAREARKHNAEARAERHQWEREFSIA